MGDVWGTETLDLDGYLTRVGQPVQPPSRAALDELHEAHVRAFTFDNIDVLLDQHPGVALGQVEAKFVGRGRGGYCFEHGTLFAAVLERLGYDVTRRLGRVGLARTHCVVSVDIDGERVLADPGFGMSVLRPIPLVDGATDDFRGWSYRVRELRLGDVRAWELARWRDDAWEPMHTHDELPVEPADLETGHHYTSTYPASHFRHQLMVTRHGEGRHTSVTHRTLTVRRPGEPTEHREIELAEVRDLLHELEVPLTGDEEARLLARAEQLRATVA
ncbi:MAG TPA: arylamine N-acetyltransferase [Nocardioides sp.]|uniref:arylamine N-acetyltransferase family protein n=1 Tax=uncultured Nocardioides sp. TaxID=198441 RepID=UPI000EE573B1|nr:arylamine N-acetyltransferase [uncultured Nocardioides sp.]HCB06100.1 arylamine N-acetyltransferase [Nocardioides sp.]HRI96601.1 arylamine N-acetyltransferase [Nocardioides sp.]HRK46837.1 arylamine N-acetyltransferase [Nocardioides sp.]